MHILQIHNRYVHLGGEDFVIAQEKKLLEQAGHRVSQFIVNNKDIDTPIKKVKTALSMPYNTEQKKEVFVALQNLKPDVVHIHNVFPVLSPAVLDACSAIKVPVVVTLHNYRLICINGLLYRDGNVCLKCIDSSFATSGVLHGCYQNSSAASVFPAITNYIHSRRKTWQENVSVFIMLSSFTKSIFDKSHLQIPQRKIAIKSNFCPDQIPQYDKQDYFLFVGRLSEEKGIRTVVRAFLTTGDLLKIAGEGPLLSWLLEISEKNKNIIVLGFQNQEKLKSLYANARALIYASRWYETFGLVIIEAFSFGTPVIAPDFGNASVFVQENNNGMKYKLENPESLIICVEKFKNHNNEAELRKGARSSYEKSYTPEKSLKGLLDIYTKAISVSAQS